MLTFQPPSANDIPPVLPTTRGISYLLYRHYGNRPRSYTILKIGGTYASYQSPTQDDIDSATEVYLGGHKYVVSQATADALTAAGFGAGITEPTEWGDLGLWGEMGTWENP